MLGLDGMRAAVGALSLLVILGLGGPAQAGHGFFVPPMRVDLSPATMSGPDGTMIGMHALAGVYWASLWPGKRTPVDVGVGYLYEAYRTGEPRSQLLAAGMAPEEPLLELHGTYVELARRAGGNHGRRGWIGARAEVLFSEVGGRRRAGVGFAGRAAWELFVPVKGGGNNGVIVGTFALGVYLELAARQLPDGKGALQSTAGLSMRIPLIAVGD